MRSEELVTCIEEAFGGLEKPLPEEMAAPNLYHEQEYLDAVKGRAWQELRPLRRYVGDGADIAFLSAKAYQYYIPAYLVALVDRRAEQFYLHGVLDSLWYESGPPSPDLFDPSKGVQETLEVLEARMPYLPERVREAIAEKRPRICEDLAEMKRATGPGWVDRPYSLFRWEEQMRFLTDPQKRCIANLLIEILARSEDPFDVPRIETMLERYWGAYVSSPEGPPGEHWCPPQC